MPADFDASVDVCLAINTAVDQTISCAGGFAFSSGSGRVYYRVVDDTGSIAVADPVTATPVHVPEPQTILLILTALVWLGLRKRRELATIGPV